VVGVVNGILCAVGGYQGPGSSPIASVQAYDPVSDTWTNKAPIPTVRGRFAGGVVNGILYAVGGWTTGTPCATVEAYDPVSDTWTNKGPMPAAVDYTSAGVVNGILYIMGCSGTQNTLWEYNPVTDTWTINNAPMPTRRFALGAGVVNNVLFAVGGVTCDGLSYGVTTNEAFMLLPRLALNMYAGLTIMGLVGSTYEIDYSNNLTNWTALTNIILPSSPYLFIDTTSTYFSTRFYRAIYLP
jgi:hypothetical protein